MKIGASDDPELLPREEWARDLATARSLGLSCRRCGECAWSAGAGAGVAARLRQSGATAKS